MSGERRLKDIKANHLVLQVPQGASQGLAKVAGTSCNQDSHIQTPSPVLPELSPTLAADCCMAHFVRQTATCRLVHGSAYGTRTRAPALRGPCPNRLDERATWEPQMYRENAQTQGGDRRSAHRAER
jgi:hypothetical protein